jgi:hypothetical protein
MTSLTIKSLAQPSWTATKKDRCRCTAAQAVAVALLANGMGNTAMASERTKAAIAEQQKFSALLKMPRAGLT